LKEDCLAVFTPPYFVGNLGAVASKATMLRTLFMHSVFFASKSITEAGLRALSRDRLAYQGGYFSKSSALAAETHDVSTFFSIDIKESSSCESERFVENQFIGGVSRDVAGR